jgi:hypothetical protein
MEITFLKVEEMWGENALQVIQAYGTQTGLTDCSIILGACVSHPHYRTIEADRAGIIFLITPDGHGNVRSVNANGNFAIFPLHAARGTSAHYAANAFNAADACYASARLVLPSEETSKIPKNEVEIREVKLKNSNIVKIGTFGEYPQTIADNSTSKLLEANWKQGLLQTTAKTYTFFSSPYGDFNPIKYPEYELNGKKYTRLDGMPYSGNSLLSNNCKVEKGEAYWVEVLPIEWLIDETDRWITKLGIFSGIPFDTNGNYNGNFEETVIKSYLNDNFSKEMVPSQTKALAQEAKHTQTVKLHNRYGIPVEDTPMPVKDQINFYVKHCLTFMLHGPSGIGKTRRIEDIDPDLTAIPLYNGVLPEDIVGKVVYPNGAIGLPDDEKQFGGRWVAPDWYIELCRKCEAEPDKKHVLFIDEITNARPTTQSLIFHIVLKKSISPSKGKLPDNAVVVLAGNSREESGAAYNMPEPLFRRMVAHIHLEPNVPEWLEWASDKSRRNPGRLNIHPVVASFVATYEDQAFFSSYDEEMPPKWAIDPRGWEQISDVIYKNEGVIQRELLENKMGQELTDSFLTYAKNPLLSLQEVLEIVALQEKPAHRIPNSHDAKLALALGLRHANDKEVVLVRQFIEDNLGKEILAVFDPVWANKDEERALQIKILQQMKNQQQINPVDQIESLEP